MEDNSDEYIEEQLKKVVPGALRQVLKSMASEPTTLVIESNDTEGDISEATVADIRKWLFRGR